MRKNSPHDPPTILTLPLYLGTRYVFSIRTVAWLAFLATVALFLVAMASLFARALTASTYAMALQ